MLGTDGLGNSSAEKGMMVLMESQLNRSHHCMMAVMKTRLNHCESRQETELVPLTLLSLDHIWKCVFSFGPHSTWKMNLNKSSQGPTRQLVDCSTRGKSERMQLVRTWHDTALENLMQFAFITLWRGYQEHTAMPSTKVHGGRMRENRNKLKQNRFQLPYGTTFSLSGQPSSRRACQDLLLKETFLEVSRLNWIKPWPSWSDFRVYSAVSNKLV